MLQFIVSILAAVRVFFRSRAESSLEILALRQQLAVFKRKHPRAALNSVDRLFWTTLRRVWSRWAEVLVIVKPETVVGWHRAGFRFYWRWQSQRYSGRPKTTAEIRALIHRLAEENPDWGAPKIHGELLKLGFKVSERTVARYLQRVGRRGDPGQRWLTLLQNTARRSLLWISSPPSERRVGPQQLRETFPEAGPYRYVILDHDSKFDAEVITFLKATGLKAKRTSIQSPWQNGTAERWVGGCRKELLGFVIPLNEEHLRRLMREYVCYFHEDRIHDSLGKDTPHRRPVEQRPSAKATARHDHAVCRPGHRHRAGSRGALPSPPAA